MIEFKNVTKHYGNNVGLENATVRIEKGDFVFLVDESAANEKKGAFAVSAFSQVDNKNEVYVAAK